MNLLEIEKIISSDKSFKEYLESDGEGGETAFALGLIIQTIEQDGASLTDYEVLQYIKDISDLYQHYLAKEKVSK